MAKNVKVIVIRTAGTNCDQETVHAFREFGANVDLVHINKVLAKEVKLKDYHLLAVPGGFSYGDDVASGKILANELALRLGEQVCPFICDGKLVIGICNGFQVLVKAGILPGPLTDKIDKNQPLAPQATLTFNDSGKFEDRWTRLKVSGKSVWTQGMEGVVYFPVAHGEGKFVPKDETVLKKLNENGQIAFRYVSTDGRKPKSFDPPLQKSGVRSGFRPMEKDNRAPYPENPNGSTDDIAGITDKTGRILGLMPHPERHFLFIHHPHWTRLEKRQKYGDGAKIFENGVKYVKDYLL